MDSYSVRMRLPRIGDIGDEEPLIEEVVEVGGKWYKSREVDAEAQNRAIADTQTQKQITFLEEQLNFCVCYISGTEGHEEEPEQTLEWIKSQVLLAREPQHHE